MIEYLSNFDETTLDHLLEISAGPMKNIRNKNWTGSSAIEH